MSTTTQFCFCGRDVPAAQRDVHRAQHRIVELVGRIDERLARAAHEVETGHPASAAVARTEAGAYLDELRRMPEATAVMRRMQPRTWAGAL